MIKIKLFHAVFALHILFFGTAKAQPIPIELMMGTKMGLAFNLDENGPNPSVESNPGVFIRKEIF